MAPHPCRREPLVSPVTMADFWPQEEMIDLEKFLAEQCDSNRPMERSTAEQPSTIESRLNYDMRCSLWGNYDMWRSEPLVDVSYLHGMTGIPSNTASATSFDSPPIMREPVVKDPLSSAMFGTVDGKLDSSSRFTVADCNSMGSTSVDVNSSIESYGSEVDVEVSIDSSHMTFTERSPSRTYEVHVVGGGRDTTFYVNFEEIQLKANKLAELLKSANGQAPQIHVDVHDFEIFLRFLCGSYDSETRWSSLGKYIDTILTLAQRFAVSTMIRECKKFVLQTDFHTTDLISILRYFKAFENTGVDLIGYKQGAFRPVRSHIISGLVCAGRWPEFSRLLGRPCYNTAIKNRLRRGNLSPAAVNLHLFNFFVMHGNAYDLSGKEVEAKNALQAIFPNLRVTCQVGI